MQGHGHVGIRREHKVYEPGQGCVPIDEMPQLVPDNKPQFVLGHESEERRIDVHDVRFFLVLGCYRKGIHRGVAGNVEVDLFLEVQFSAHFVTKVVEVLEQVLLHLQAVSFHGTAPIGIGIGGLYLAKDLLHNRTLQCIVYLFSDLLLQLNRCGKASVLLSVILVGSLEPVP